MADNITTNPGSGGATIASDEIAGVQFQRVKPAFGPDGSATDVSVAAPLPVRVEGAPAAEFFVSHLNDSGTDDASVNGAATAVNFDAGPGGADVWLLEEVVLTWVDDVQPDPFGFIGATALTTGLTLEVRNGAGQVLDLLDGNPILRLFDLGRVGFEIQPDPFGNSGSWTVVATLRFPTPLRLEASDSQILRLAVNDDLTALRRLFCVARGRVG